MRLPFLLLSLLGTLLAFAGLAVGSRWLTFAGAFTTFAVTALQFFDAGPPPEGESEQEGDAVGLAADAEKLPPPARLTPLTESTKRALLALALGTGLVYYFSNPRPQVYFDYTYRIAGALLRGDLGMTEQPPSWLNEMVPSGGRYYSVFPLGAVLSMLPVALLKEAQFVEAFPSALVAAAIAAAASVFLFLLTLRYDVSERRRWLLVMSVLFGTWAWCNLTFGGAWQIALGLAVVGQLGALYFTLVLARPLVAGLFFALAFGNRSEIVLLAPVFMYLAGRDSFKSAGTLRGRWPALLKFCAFPFLLGSATLAYNYFRFGSPFDFGYARIPGVLDEPWYKHGLFSFRAIPLNARAMLYETWKTSGSYPYLIPKGFGGSIFLASPLLLLLFRRGARDRGLKIVAWAAIALLTLVLWLHGNPGGWQFSYRYAMILLPWAFLILLESGPREATAAETALAAASVAVNAYATYLFHWTDYVRP